jgi:hypothetical protein
MRAVLPLLVASCSSRVPPEMGCERVACARYYKVNGNQVQFEGIELPVAGNVVEVGATDIRPELLVSPSAEMLLLDQSQFAFCKSANAVRHQPSVCQQTQKEYRDAVQALVATATATELQTWYQDLDGDGHGTTLSSKQAFVAPHGYVADPRDCLDTDVSVHPSAPEVCNGVDDNCDGQIDLRATDPRTWFRDGDADGSGTGCEAQTACAAPEGYVANADDPDDADPAVRAYAAGVSLFTDVGFGGESEIFKLGDHLDLRSSSMNDHGSSIRVPPGFQALVCEDIQLTGACDTFTSDQDRLHRSATAVKNDAVSSIRVSRVCPAP